MSATLELDHIQRRLLTPEGAVHLTPREFHLLQQLVDHPNRVHSYESLLRDVWGWTFGDVDTVHTTASRLRSKLGQAERRRLETVHGRGYRWRE